MKTKTMLLPLPLRASALAVTNESREPDIISQNPPPTRVQKPVPALLLRTTAWNAAGVHASLGSSNRPRQTGLQRHQRTIGQRLGGTAERVETRDERLTPRSEFNVLVPVTVTLLLARPVTRIGHRRFEHRSSWFGPRSIDSSFETSFGRNSFAPTLGKERGRGRDPSGRCAAPCSPTRPRSCRPRPPPRARRRRGDQAASSLRRESTDSQSHPTVRPCARRRQRYRRVRSLASHRARGPRGRAEGRRPHQHLGHLACEYPLPRPAVDPRVVSPGRRQSREGLALGRGSLRPERPSLPFPVSILPYPFRVPAHPVKVLLLCGVPRGGSAALERRGEPRSAPAGSRGESSPAPAPRYQTPPSRHATALTTPAA